MSQVADVPIALSDSEGMRFAKLQLFIRNAVDNAGIGYTIGGYLSDISLSDSEGLRFAKLGAWLELLADNIAGSGSSAGTGRSGVDETVTTYAQLAALPMTGVTLPSVKVWIRASSGTSEIWQAISSNAANDPDNGVVRSDSWVSTNAVWFKRG